MPRPTVAGSDDPFFFFNDTATTEIYTLSLHDALPISVRTTRPEVLQSIPRTSPSARAASPSADRKSTRLNSSHSQISYAVFCLKKKNTDARSRRQDADFSPDQGLQAARQGPRGLERPF